MADSFFPVFLKLSKRRCLMIGGEGCAVEKAETLLEAGAVLTVVAPRLAAGLKKAAAAGQLTWLAEPFQEKQMDNQWFVISTLQKREENHRIYAEAERRSLFLNVVDQPEYCTFHWPAILQRPPVTVAMATGGKSPALSGYLRRKIEGIVPEQIGTLAEWLSVWRQDVSPQLPNLETKGRFWRNLLDQGLAERFLSGDQQGAETMIRNALAQQVLRS